MCKYGVLSGPYFPVFGLNTEIYGVNLRIHSEHREIRTRKNSIFDHFSRSDSVHLLHKEWSFPCRISLVNVDKSAVFWEKIKIFLKISLTENCIS